MNDAIKVEDLEVRYGNYVALQEVSFRLPHPSILAVIGPNGAGKTTLLKSLIGLIKPVKGKINIFGIDAIHDPESVRKIIGYVPQRERVAEHIPIRAKDIVLLPKLVRAGPLTIPRKIDILAAKEALETVLLPRETWDKKFSELSGGQKQKVLIARALVLQPKLLLLDEPFSGVDAPSQREIMELIYELKKENISTILVTHDINPIIEYIDYLLLLNKKAISFGVPDKVLTEENLSKAYGIKIKIITHRGACYAIIGDYHA